jgi:hypothetical protein
VARRCEDEKQSGIVGQGLQAHRNALRQTRSELLLSPVPRCRRGILALSKREETDASRFVAKFPVIRLEFPVGRKNFPDSLLREFPKKSLRRSGFLL